MTTLVIDNNYSRIDDETIWDVIEFADDSVTAPDGYTVRQSGDDVLVFRNEDEATLHCLIVDDDATV